MFDRLGIKGVDNGTDRIREGHVFPEPDDSPAGIVKSSVGGTVPLDVAAEFGGPIPLVRRGLSTMLGAYVPETAVHEDRDLPGREDDVRANTSAVGEVEPVILAVPVAHGMQRFAQGNFGFGIGSPIGPHVPRAAFASGGGVTRPDRCTVVGRVSWHDPCRVSSCRGRGSLPEEDTASGWCSSCGFHITRGVNGKA